MENLQKKIRILLDLFKSKNFFKAEALNKELIKAYPKIVFLYNSLGLILYEQNRLDESIQIYKKGIKIEPNYAMIYNNLGTIYKKKGDLTKAGNYFKKSIKLNKKISEPYNNLGNLFLSLNEHNKAINCYKEAVKISPKFFPSHYNLGSIYINIGKYEFAKKHLKESIKLNPYFYPAHRNLSTLTKYSKDNEHFKHLIKLYNNKSNMEQKAELEFSLGKAFDDIKDFKTAFKHYNAGNNLRRKDVIFSLEEERENFNKIKKVFDINLFNKFKKIKDSNSRSIFILGMPRSGTTLIEQILSSHKIVYGADELNFLPNLVEKYFTNQKNSDFLDNITTFDKNFFKGIGREYIGNIKKISNNSKKVTDKLPINFKWIGLIRLILPNAIIIHSVRNPRDTCLSIFKNYFTNTNLNYAYNLKEITGFYGLYDDLMKHWKTLLPNFIIDIKYENIIKDPEKEIHYLLKKCKLSWDKNCLKFYNNKRPIKTASFTQARKKIYSTSIDNWKNYENDLRIYFEKLPK